MHFEETWQSFDHLKAQEALKFESLNHPSMADQYQTEIKKSQKLGNATRLYFYLQSQKRDLVATVDYETFVKSWAGQNWLEKNISKIKELAERENSLLANRGLRKKWYVDYMPVLKEGIVKEFQYSPQEQESPDFNLGKQQAMDGLTQCIEKIPDNAKISYETFAKFLVRQHLKYGKRSASKVADYTRGWNLILRLVNQTISTPILTKDELAEIIGFVGEKELRWN